MNSGSELNTTLKRAASNNYQGLNADRVMGVRTQSWNHEMMMNCLARCTDHRTPEGPLMTGVSFWGSEAHWKQWEFVLWF